MFQFIVGGSRYRSNRNLQYPLKAKPTGRLDRPSLGYDHRVITLMAMIPKTRFSLCGLGLARHKYGCDARAKRRPLTLNGDNFSCVTPVGTSGDRVSKEYNREGLNQFLF